MTVGLSFFPVVGNSCNYFSSVCVQTPGCTFPEELFGMFQVKLNFNWVWYEYDFIQPNQKEV